MVELPHDRDLAQCAPARQRVLKGRRDFLDRHLLTGGGIVGGAVGAGHGQSRSQRDRVANSLPKRHRQPLPRQEGEFRGRGCGGRKTVCWGHWRRARRASKPTHHTIPYAPLPRASVMVYRRSTTKSQLPTRKRCLPEPAAPQGSTRRPRESAPSAAPAMPPVRATGGPRGPVHAAREWRGRRGQGGHESAQVPSGLGGWDHEVPFRRILSGHAAPCPKAPVPGTTASQSSRFGRRLGPALCACR